MTEALVCFRQDLGCEEKLVKKSEEKETETLHQITLKGII